MKTAVLLSGLARDYRNASVSFKRFYADEQCDVFMHTWRLLDERCSPDSHAGIVLDKVHPDEAQLREAFGLKECVVDDLSLEHVSSIRSKDSSMTDAAVRGMCRNESTKRVFELADRCVGYDRVVVTRPDVFYFSNTLLPSPVDGEVHAPTLPNMRTGKCLLTKMEEENPDAVCDWMNDFYAVCTPASAEALVAFDVNFLNIVKEYPLKTHPYLVDRALAVYLKKVAKLKVIEFSMEIGLQRDGKVQRFY